MTNKVMAFECPSALRKFIPFCEARWRANAARLQCWKGAAMQIPWKWEGSRAPRRNPDPVGPGPTKSEIGKPLKTSCETNVFSGELFSPRPRPARHRGAIFGQEALSGLHFVGFVGLGPRTSMNRFLQEVLCGLLIFGSVKPDPNIFLCTSPTQFCHFRVGR